MLVPPLPSTLGCLGEGILSCHEGASGILWRGTLGKELSHVRAILEVAPQPSGACSGSFHYQHVRRDDNIMKDSKLKTFHQTMPQRANTGVLSC